MKNKPHILMLGTSPHTKGGVSTLISGYLSSRELNKKYLIKYLSTHCDGSFLKKMVIAFAGYIHFVYLMFFFHPRIVHIHAASRASFYRKSIFVITSRLLKKPVVYHHHGGEFMKFFHDESGPFIKKIIRFVLSKSSIIIVLSSQWKKNLETIDPSLPMQILPNAVVIPALKVHRKNNEQIVKILFMGKVCERKGVYDLLTAIEILATSTSNFRLIIGGDGDTNAWRKICSEKLIENLVSFKGWISGETKEVLYEQADIFVLPSYNEGLPMSILEAISYGLPVVTTSVGGIPDAVFEGINGFLVTPGDVSGLVERLQILITDKSLRSKMGRASRKLAEDTFDLNIVTQSLEKIYTKILTNHVY